MWRADRAHSRASLERVAQALILYGALYGSVFGALCLSASPAVARCDQEGRLSDAPSWVRQGHPEGRRYRYYVGRGDAQLLSVSFKRAFSQALAMVIEEREVDVSSRVDLIREEREQIEQRLGKLSQTLKTYERDSLMTQTRASGVVRGAELDDVYTSACGEQITVVVRLRIKRARPDLSIPLPLKPRDLMLRSALVPGWGQLHAGHQLKGGLLMGSFFVSAATTGFLFWRSGVDFDEAASASRSADRAFFDERARRYRGFAWGGALLSLGLYGYGLFDSYYVEPERQYYAFSVDPMTQRAVFALRW